MGNIETVGEFTMYLPDRGVVGLNNAYAHIMRGKGRRKFAQRILTEAAREYKRKWTDLFATGDFPDCHHLQESDKPFLMLELTLIYNEAYAVYSTGRIAGVDLTNAPKLIEDALCEYIGVDDARTIWVASSKLIIPDVITQIRLKVGFAERNRIHNKNLRTISEMSMLDDYHLPTFDAMSPTTRSDVVEVVRQYVNDPQYVDGVMKALQQYGSDSHMFFTLICQMTDTKLLKPGFWTAYIKAFRQPGAESSKKLPKTLSDMRGLLPFATPPKHLETREEWRSRVKIKPYDHNMLCSDGSINWDAPIVYGYKKDSPAWYVYRALVNARCTYGQLLELSIKDKKISKRSVDTVLKAMMSKHDILPPGAGEYRESEQTGEIWIERDPDRARIETYPF